MASQPPVQLESYEIRSFIRGVHAYKEHWHSVRSGQIFKLSREPDNCCDKCAVDVTTEDNTIVGHIPYNLAPLISPFLTRDFNKGTVNVTGERMNRVAGYGLEVPCTNRLYGPKVYVDRLKALVVRLEDRIQ